MKYGPKILALIAAMLFSTALGFAGWLESAQKQADKGNLAKAKEIVLKRLGKRSGDGEAVRELGVLFYREAAYDSALTRLQTADELRPADERVLLFWGMTHERIEQPSAAMEVYRKLDTPTLRARLEIVNDQELQKAISVALQAETDLKKLGIVVTQVDSSLATMEFSASTLPDSLRPLGRGMSALLASDLQVLTPYHVMERTRLQPLFDELVLRDIGVIDSSARNAAIGKLTGAKLLVTGQLDLEQDALSANAHLVAVPAGESEFAGDADGVLTAFYLIEKSLLSQLLNALGVTLDTEGERWLASIPTESLPAFLAYSQGLELWDQGNREAALLAFQRATELDPLFSLAHNEYAWRDVSMRSGEGLSGFEQFSSAEPAPQEPPSSEPETQFTLRDFIGSVNPNAIDKTASLTEDPKTDPRDIPFADQFGPWINISVRPYRP